MGTKRVCRLCHKTIPMGDYKSEYGICGPCEDKLSLRRWDYKPNYWDMKKTDNEGNNVDYIGIEFEFEGKSNNPDNSYEGAIELLKDSPFTSHFCYDGSLSESGREAVFHPMSYAYMRKHKKHFYDMLSRMQDYTTAWNNGRCGLHTHHSKAGLKRIEIYKILMFVMKNREFLYKISGKNTRSWSRYAQQIDTSHKCIIESSINGEGLWSDQHHRLINLENQKTIELRWFRNTLNANMFWGMIQFNKALIDWCKICPVGDLNPYALIKYINKRGYKEAIQLINKRMKRDGCEETD